MTHPSEQEFDALATRILLQSTDLRIIPKGLIARLLAPVRGPVRIPRPQLREVKCVAYRDHPSFREKLAPMGETVEIVDIVTPAKTYTLFFDAPHGAEFAAAATAWMRR